MANNTSVDEPHALADSTSLNGELVDLCTRFEGALFDWMDRALATQPVAQRVPLKLAVSEVAFVLTDRLLYPTYRHFPQLIPAHLTDPAAQAGH